MTKYLTKTRVDSAIKKYGLEVAYTKGDGYFYFLDLKTRCQVGESVMVARLHHFTIQQWREAAAVARAMTHQEGINGDAAKLREIVAEL